MAKISTRRAGVLVPLFSCVSSRSWGIGDIGDLEPMIEWLASAGQRLLQLLPVNEMSPAMNSPYTAISAMAIDPVFIRLSAVEDYAAIGGERSLSAVDRAVLDAVRAAPVIQHREVRALKMAALRAAFCRFLDAEWRRGTPRADELRAFVQEQAWWIEDYALFRAVHAREDERPWTAWPEPLKQRDPSALDRARLELGDELLFLQYLQWLAHVQWLAVRVSARARGVELFGDVPFMVDASSCSATSRSWSTPTAPTCGCTRTTSTWTPRSARLRTPSARLDRIGECRYTGGSALRPAGSSGSASAHGALPGSSTAAG
jgi:4-alpha-glucanotransferase